MDLNPHNPNDENPGEDTTSNIEVKRFGFLIEDCAAIETLIAGVRKALKRKSITPRQICGLGKLLLGLERLPRPTSGIDITVSIGARTPNHFSCQSVSLSDSSFDIESGGSEYTPDVGSDSYTSFSFNVEVGGFRDDTAAEEVYNWVSDFIESLCDESQDIEVEDQTDESMLDWDEKTPEDDWDRLENN